MGQSTHGIRDSSQVNHQFYQGELGSIFLFSSCVQAREILEINIVHAGASQVMLVIKKLPANAGDIRDLGSIPALGSSPGGGHGNPLQ